MSTITVTFVQATFYLATFDYISNISAVAEPIFLSSSLTNAINQGDICLGNIYPDGSNIGTVTDPILTKLLGPKYFWSKNCFGPKIFLDHNFFWP